MLSTGHYGRYRLYCRHCHTTTIVSSTAPSSTQQPHPLTRSLAHTTLFLTRSHSHSPTRPLARSLTRRYLDSLDTTWEARYAEEPATGVAEEDEHLVLGGGGQMWGETADPSDVLPTIWPGMAAIAERLWSSRDVTDTVEAAPRLAGFRCLMESRGVPFAPITNLISRSAPSGPGSCTAQRRRHV